MKYNKQHQGDKNRCKSRCKGGKPYERENEGEKYLLHSPHDWPTSRSIISGYFFSARRGKPNTRKPYHAMKVPSLINK